MFDVDPRDVDDSRERDDRVWHPDRKWREAAGSTAAGDGHDRAIDDHSHDEHDHDERHRDDENDGPHLGRGPSSHDEKLDSDPRSRDDGRWPDRDRDPQLVFMRDLNLPRGPGRELVHDGRHRKYSLRGSETRTLATVGAFRVVPVGNLQDRDWKAADPRAGDLRHLRAQGLIRVERVPGHRDQVVTLTDRARDLLRTHQVDGRQGNRQTFHAGLVKPREVEHDAQLYRAYEREAAKLADRLGVPACDLDNLFWDNAAARYDVRADPAERDRKLASVVSGEGWIIDVHVELDQLHARAHPVAQALK